MNSKHKMVIVGLVTLVVGFGAGFATASSGHGKYAGRMQGSPRQAMDGMMPEGVEGRRVRGDMQMGGQGMQTMMHDMNAGLEGKTGEEFDRAFLQQMIAHHEGAVQMSEAALKNAQHQELKDLATSIIAAQKKEIDQMKKWEAAWYQN